MAYDMDANYAYIYNSLATLIASVGGDETAANSITFDDLKSKITINFTDSVPEDPSTWTAAQRASYRSRQRKYDIGRKLVYQRDLLKAGNG